MSHAKIRVRKELNADALFQHIRAEFGKIPDLCPGKVKISVADALMSGFAMFSLKDPSLLACDQRRKDDTTRKNLTTIYHINDVPCDTQMRVILDDVETEELRPVSQSIFRQAQRGKVLEKLLFLDGCYLLSLDGTQYFSSKKIQCDSCVEQVNSTTGDITYSHQLLGAALVHPDCREVIPLCPEPIKKQDGETKHDCERNAATRFLTQCRTDHPHLNVIVIEDGLSSNAPHIRELVQQQMHVILGVKRGDHAWLCEQVDTAERNGTLTKYRLKRDGVLHTFRVLNTVTLNTSNQDVRVNFLEYWDIQADGTSQHWCWVTDVSITRKTVFQLMRGGRARWKIENETFNALKNQGDHFAHNYGHGEHNVSVVFAMLMMLACVVDQVLQLSCRLFQAAWQKVGCKIRLWEQIRAVFFPLEFASMEDLFRALLYGYRVERLIIHDSS